jgi:GT2 family glycosyltransferase
MISSKVSIIIPTYNDWSRTALCLKSLKEQNYPKNLFEIILVNNNPANRMPDGMSVPENCIVLDESKPGSYAARNAALNIASGEIIGFTDSDCIADKDWISNAVSLFNNEEVQRIGGMINIFFKKKRPSKVELHDKVFAFPQKVLAKSGKAVTGNMFTRKSVFDKIGFFDDTLMSGGDVKWGQLAQNSGFDIIYANNVVINHPARPTLKELLKKTKRVGNSEGSIAKNQKSSLVNIIPQLIAANRPRMYEIRSIFKRNDLSLVDKVSVALIRHYIISVKNITRIISANSHRTNIVIILFLDTLVNTNELLFDI